MPTRAKANASPCREDVVDRHVPLALAGEVGPEAARDRPRNAAAVGKKCPPRTSRATGRCSRPGAGRESFSANAHDLGMDRVVDAGRAG